MALSADAAIPLLTLQTVPPGSDPPSGLVAWDLLRLVGYGMLLLWGLWWWGSRLGKWPSLQKWARAHGSLRVLETRPLGFRSQLHLIAYGEQRFLIGSSPAGIHLISEVGDAGTSLIGGGFTEAQVRARDLAADPFATATGTPDQKPSKIPHPTP